MGKKISPDHRESDSSKREGILEIELDMAETDHTSNLFDLDLYLEGVN